MNEFTGPEWEPRIDVEEAEEFLVLRAAVPGIAPTEMLAEVGDRTVFLHGEGGGTGRRFDCTVPLPTEVKPGQVRVAMSDFFILHMPKAKTLERQ